MNTTTKSLIPENSIVQLAILAERPDFKKLLYVPKVNLVLVISCLFSLTAWYFLGNLWLGGNLSLAWLLALSTYTFFIYILTIHEGSHLTMARNKTVNDILTTVLTFIPYPHLSVMPFRHQHLTHHRDTCGDEDPDEYLYSGNFITRTLKVFTHDFYWAYWSFINRNTATKPTHLANIFGMIAYIIILTVGLTSNYWYEFTMLYILPQRIGIAVAIYMFAYVQHPPEKCEVKEISPFKTTAIIRGFDSAFAKVYFGQNRHLIHHLYPNMPIYRNWKAWIIGKDIFDQQELVNIGIGANEFNKIKVNKPTNDGSMLVVIDKVETVADGINAYTFRAINTERLPSFTPGAHIDVEIVSGLIRQYSLCNNSTDHNTYIIAVQKEENGRGGSQQLHDTFKEGDIIRIGKPRNLFSLKPAESVVLFAGGIGITPMLSMAWSLHLSNTPFEFHYCIGTRSKWAFKSHWEHLPFSKNIHVYINDNKSQNPIDAIQIMVNNASADVYVCGPEGFMNFIETSAENSGLAKEQFNKESFSASTTIDEHTKPFTLSIKGSNKIYNVPADKSIIDTLKKENIFIPVSCENGICGTCKCKINEGEVEHKDLVLNDEEKQHQRLFTPCVSRAKNEHIEIIL